MNCHHCKKGIICRPRNLCSVCYKDTTIRESMPFKKIILGIGQGCGGYKLPEPTSARPGTAEKLKVMRQRALKGESIFHKKDAEL